MTIPENIIEEIRKYLKDGKSHRWITQNVIYEMKNGKMRTVSLGSVNSINKNKR